MSASANNLPQRIAAIESHFIVAAEVESGTVFQQVLLYLQEQRQRDLQSEEHALTTRLNYVRGQLGKPKLSHLCSKCKGAV